MKYAILQNQASQDLSKSKTQTPFFQIHKKKSSYGISYHVIAYLDIQTRPKSEWLIMISENASRMVSYVSDWEWTVLSDAR